MAETHVRPLEFKLLLEGRLTPFSDFQIEQAVNLQSVMSVRLPFSLFGAGIRPRTHVALFYRYADVDDMPFSLLFTGDVTGRSYTKASSTRSLELTCQSYASYLNNSFLLNTGAQNGADITAGIIQAKAIGGDGTPAAAAPFQTTLSNLMRSGFAQYIYGVLTKFLTAGQTPRVHQNKYKSIGIYDVDRPERSKLAVLPNTFLERFIQNLSKESLTGMDAFLKAFADNLNSQWQVHENFWQHFYKMLQWFMLDYVENCSVTNPAFLYKPNFYYGTPPRCNVIFPCQYNGLSFSEAFLQSPTRMIYNSNSILSQNNSGSAPIFSATDVAPAELSLAIAKHMATDATPADKFRLFTAEEAEKGIIPYIDAENQMDALWFKALLLSEKAEHKQLLQCWMDHKFYQIKMASRSISLTDCAFMPQLICGFPSIVIDSHILYSGYVNKIVHYGSASGRAGTRVGLSYAKNMLELTPGFPFWIDNLVGPDVPTTDEVEQKHAYTYHHIGGMIYQKFLGCDSVKRDPKEIEAVRAYVEASDPKKLPLFDDDMVGMFTPPDIKGNDAAVYSTVKAGADVQRLIYKSVLASVVEYWQSGNKIRYADAYTYRKAASFSEFIDRYAEFVEPEDPDTVKEGGICSLTIKEHTVKDIDSDRNNFFRFFLSRPTRYIIDLYVDKLSTVMADSDIFRFERVDDGK